MNCKPGDLAIVVDAPAHAAHVIGCIGTCISTFELDGRTIWNFDPPAKGHYWGVNDFWLRPIRDPGDDARDETLNWLPVPTQEGVEA